jgi:hypothetical protein
LKPEQFDQARAIAQKIRDPKMQQDTLKSLDELQ